jgi:cyanate permease
MVFSFGPALLIERGLGPAAAGSMTSLFMFVFAVAVPVRRCARRQDRAARPRHRGEPAELRALIPLA